MKRNLFILFAIAFVTLIAQAQIPSGTVYLHQNLHFVNVKGERKAAYSNFTGPVDGHSFLPVNSRVSLKKWGKKGVIVLPESGQPEKIFFEYHEPRMGMTIHNYLPLICGEEPKPMSGFSEVDQQGISEGKALVGMSKEAVRVSLGYPAAHMTPNMDAAQWIYWVNRLKSRTVEFDADGLVSGANPGW
jgi:hypothetical protein